MNLKITVQDESFLPHLFSFTPFDFLATELILIASTQLLSGLLALIVLHHSHTSKKALQPELTILIGMMFLSDKTYQNVLRVDNESQLAQQFSLKCLAMLSYNLQPIGLILSHQNLDEVRRFSPRINSRVLSYLPNDDEGKNKRIAFQKWLEFGKTVFLSRDEFREYEQSESEIVKIGYYLPFNVLQEGEKPSYLNWQKFWSSVFKLIMQPDVQVLERYNDLLESLYGGKVNESYFVIKQLNDKRWLNLYKERYGILRVNNGKFEPADYPNSEELMRIYDRYTYGHAFGRHMKGLSKPLFYYFDGTGLRPYIRSVLGPAHDAHHPVLGFSASLHEEIGILSFYTFYDHRFNVVPTYWAPGLIGVAGGLLKAHFDYFSSKLNKLTEGEINESKNLFCRWMTNAWLGMHLAENAKVGFYSYRWLSHDTFAKSLNRVREEIGIQVNQGTIDLMNNCSNIKTVPIFWRLLGIASRIMYEVSIADSPEILEKLLSDLKEELTKAAHNLHGKEKISRILSSAAKNGELYKVMPR